MNDIKQTSFDKDKLDFAIFCIENVAKKLNQNPRDTYDALTKKVILLCLILFHLMMFCTLKAKNILQTILFPLCAKKVWQRFR